MNTTKKTQNTTPTESQRNLWFALYALAHKNVIYLEPCDEKAYKLIAEFEAQVMDDAITRYRAISNPEGTA